MKKLIFTCIILSSFTSNLFSQAQVDSTNIVKEILKQQILIAMEKQAANRTHTLNNEKDKKIMVAPVMARNENKHESFRLSTTEMKIIFLLIVSVLVFSFVLIRRKKQALIRKQQEMKSNIKKIRNEQLLVSIDPRLKAIRKKLVLNSTTLNPNEKEKFIRENKLAVSEIALAAKLKQYETAVLERGEL